MKRNIQKSNLRTIGPNGNGMVQKGTGREQQSRRVKRMASDVFLGPSVEGADQEYIKVLSGKVEHKKPSFA